MADRGWGALAATSGVSVGLSSLSSAALVTGFMYCARLRAFAGPES